MFPAFGALGGASGAFVLLYIDALAEAGVRAGFSRPHGRGDRNGYRHGQQRFGYGQR